ncbi:tensin-4 [Limosa lapponica baueri]|uniref:Tensin-4 n=1 Tax=Limosa lapponica baueri TaxID=1758121 RepID=A0A2I0TLJ3_LIMLA|nr:tensin-4 [Limosa lapponica baueri]
MGTWNVLGVGVPKHPDAGFGLLRSGTERDGLVFLILRHIKYIEMTPGRATCPEQLQGSPSPLGTLFSRSPQGNGSLPQKGGLRGNYSPGGTVVFSSPPRPVSPRSGTPTSAASPTCSKASECIAVPQQCTSGQTDSISYSNSLGFDNLLKPMQVVRTQQRSSWVSLLSTSPGSDTSYILGR